MMKRFQFPLKFHLNGQECVYFQAVKSLHDKMYSESKFNPWSILRRLSNYFVMKEIDGEN